MANRHRPRRGSLAFSPRKREKTAIARFRSWSKGDGEPKMQGFAGYKAGMTHVMMVDNGSHSLTEGMEISVPVTILETPSMKIAAIRAYDHTPYGTKSLTEAWAKELDPELGRSSPSPENRDTLTALKKIEELISQGIVDDIFVLTYTLPARIPSIPKKKPDVMENRIGGGDISTRFEYAKKILGKEIDISDVFKDGELVDVAAITKGKGTQGPVKRWGVQVQKHKHARTGKKRHIGTLGPWHPARIRWQVPQLGQMGYHQRTELNKQILRIGSDSEDVNPKGGFLKYGTIGNGFVILKGTVPGSVKRLIRMRPAIRPPTVSKSIPEISYVSTESKQG